MSRWSDILDADVAAADAPPKHIEALRLPTIDGWEPGRVCSSWRVEADFITPMGVLFGGYLAAVADHLLASALFTVLGEDELLATADLHTSFFRPVRSGVLSIEAKVVNHGRRTAYCEAHFRDARGELLARAGATQVILSRPASDAP